MSAPYCRACGKPLGDREATRYFCGEPCALVFALNVLHHNPEAGLPAYFKAVRDERRQKRRDRWSIK